MKYRKINEEVFYPDENIVRVSLSLINALKKQADLNSRQRVRLCAHMEENCCVHEMLIVHKEGVYVRPHKHIRKSESFHVIEGKVDVIIFNDNGEIVQIIPMGDYLSNLTFYYRIQNPLFHTMIIRSEYVVFHEVTRGPFVRAETNFPFWAPEEKDEKRVVSFMNQLDFKYRVFCK